MIEITTPVGRLVEGSLYTGKTVDADNKPLVYKSGEKAGQPRSEYYFAIAIPKGRETHWNQTPWGKAIEDVAKEAFPKSWSRPDFSWKITDGDSTVLNMKNVRPCDKQGFPGNWIVRFSRSFAPKLYTTTADPLPEEMVIKLGYYVEVHAYVQGNSSDKTPGVYINPDMVAFSGYGEPIMHGADPKSVGFGQSPLPAGASPVPLSTFTPPVAPVPAYDADVPLADNGFTTPPPPAPPAPYPQILTAVPPPAPVRVMLAAAHGVTYEQYHAAGWTDEQLISNGLMSA